MRVLAAIALSFAPAVALAAGPTERIVEGEVTAAASRWTPGGSIVTESTIRTADGTEVLVHQLGGTVGGVGMRVVHGTPILSRGDYVAVELVEAPADTRRRRSIRGLTSPRLRQAFVRTTNASAAPLGWAKSCVFVTYDAEGTAAIPGETEFDILTNSLGQWQASPGSCTYLSFRVNPPQASDVGLDGLNTVKFRDDVWCRPTGGDPICHDPAAAGLTTLFFVNDAESERNGEILDADIELNGVTFAISADGVTSGDSSLCLADLANTATHEFGHLIGLDHTCWDGRGVRPQDNLGNPVPSCFPEANLPQSVIDATMYNFQDCDERKKQTLLQDDIDAVCTIYPAEADPGDCSEVVIDGGGCCQLSAARGRRDPRSDAGTAALLAVLLLGITAVFRRSPRRRGRNT